MYYISDKLLMLLEGTHLKGSPDFWKAAMSHSCIIHPQRICGETVGVGEWTLMPQRLLLWNKVQTMEK